MRSIHIVALALAVLARADWAFANPADSETADAVLIHARRELESLMLMLILYINANAGTPGPSHILARTRRTSVGTA